MFEIEYRFQKGGPEFHCKYPAKEDSANNIFIIKGRNDQGKSTLMQMIALGLYGLESDDIDQSLKDKMWRLVSEDTDKCEFGFVITSKDGKTKLEARLADCRSKPTLLVDGKPKSPTYVQEHFKILFDVPEEPTKKLASALKSIDHNLSQYQEYTRRYRDDIKDLNDKIDDFEGKASALKEARQRLVRLNGELASLKDRLSKVGNEFGRMEKARTINSYTKVVNEVDKLEKEKAKVATRIKELKAAGVGGGNKKYRDWLKLFTQMLYDLKFSIDTSDTLSPWLDEGEKKHLQKISKEIKDVVSVKGLTGEKLKEWKSYFDKISKKLESDPLSTKKLPEENQINLLSRLIEILKDYVDTNPEVPGTNGKNVNSFLTELETSRRQLLSKITKKAAFNKAADTCTEIIKNTVNVAGAFAEIPKVEVSDEDDLDQLRDYLTSIQDKLERSTKEWVSLAAECEKIPVGEGDDLRSLGIPDPKAYGAMKNELQGLVGKIKDHEIQIGSTEGLIKSLEKVEKPPTKLSQDQLKLLYKAADSILRKIQSWKECISKMDLEKLSVRGEIDPESEKLYSALGDYFADILKVVYFEDQGWNVEKIDFVKRRYIVKGRKPINFVDIGTGHTALNSLLAKMKQDYGGKKKILLFDEIGIMDQNNTNRLLEEITSQVKSGDVIFALLSGVDDDIEKALMEPVRCE